MFINVVQKITVDKQLHFMSKMPLLIEGIFTSYYYKFQYPFHKFAIGLATKYFL